MKGGNRYIDFEVQSMCKSIKRTYFFVRYSSRILTPWHYLMYWWLEAADMLNWHIVILTERCLQIFVQGGENLTIEDLWKTNIIVLKTFLITQLYLEPPDPVHHSLELDALDVLVLSVNPLDPEDVITEVQTLEPPLLGEEHDHHAARPVEALAEQLLHSEFVFTNCTQRER